MDAADAENTGFIYDEYSPGKRTFTNNRREYTAPKHKGEQV